MIDGKVLGRAVGRLMAMPFFPGDPMVKAAVMDDLKEICDNDEQLEYVIRRALKLYTEWPGLHELRAVHCSKFRPRDGINVSSGVYPGGIPPERPTVEPRLPPLPKGHLVTADEAFEREVRRLAQVKQMPGPRRTSKPPQMGA